MTADVIAMLPKGRRPRAPNGSRNVLKLFPKGAHKGKVYWLYAMGFKGGVTKIGRTCHPRSRLAQHWSKSNGAVEWVHLFASGTHYSSYLAESRACDLAGKKAERVLKTEWFRGLSRTDALSAVREAYASAAKTVREMDARSAINQLERELYAKARVAATEQIKALQDRAA